MNRRAAVLSMVLSLFAACPAFAQDAPPLAPAPPPAQKPADPDADRLKALMEGTRLKFAALDGANQTFAVGFQPRVAKGKDKWVVMVQWSNPDTHGYVLAFCVMLKLDGELPRRLLKAAMDYNSRTPGSKVSWDRKDGSIDVQYEIPVQFATPEYLAWAVQDVVSTCDEQYAAFSELIE